MAKFERMQTALKRISISAAESAISTKYQKHTLISFIFRELELIAVEALK
jgi:hypothetical protein